MVDASLFWSLPGPAAFVARVVAATVRGGVCAVEAPRYRPPGMADAIAAAFEAAGVLPVHRVRSRGRGSAVHQVSLAAGLGSATMRSVAGFFDLADLRGSVILVDGIEADDWRSWTPFVRSFASERRRRAGMLLPSLAVFVPPDVPRAELDRLFPEACVAWRGCVSSSDIRAYVQARTGASPADDLLQRCANEVAVSLAGYDPVLAHALCEMDPEAALDPWDALRPHYGRFEGHHPHWANGLVDYMDDQPYVHTAALVAAGDRKVFDVRRWRAVSGPVIDFAAAACRHYADAYPAVVASRLPYTAPTYGTRPPKVIDHPYGLESKHLRDCLDGVLEQDADDFLRAVARARNNVAHNDVPPSWLVRKLSGAWAGISTAEGAGVRGWSWPRCGQKLVLTVGPSGAGKSHWARLNHPPEEIVSADDIRLELDRTLVNSGPQDRVFQLAYRRVTARLARGDSVVLDATNIKRADRLRAVDLVPPDLEVVYVVVDRPMGEKVADAGWRAGRPDLLDAHAQTFAAELQAILAGDGRSNVRVIDTRNGSRTVF